MRPRSSALKEKILAFINDFYRTNNRTPSFFEIGENFSFNKATAYRYIVEMNRDGLVSYSNGVLTTDVISKCTLSKTSAPIIGSIGCGDPTQEEENIEEYVNLPESVFGTGNFYILRAKGDSMLDAGIEPGDLIVIDKDAQPINGAIVVALNDDNENTLKRFDGFENGKAVLSYMNEATYPGKRILVDFFTCQGVAKHIIKSI